MLPNEANAPEFLDNMKEKQEMEMEMNNLMGDGAADSDD